MYPEGCRIKFHNTGLDKWKFWPSDYCRNNYYILTILDDLVIGLMKGTKEPEEASQ